MADQHQIEHPTRPSPVHSNPHGAVPNSSTVEHDQRAAGEPSPAADELDAVPLAASADSSDHADEPALPGTVDAALDGADGVGPQQDEAVWPDADGPANDSDDDDGRAARARAVHDELRARALRRGRREQCADRGLLLQEQDADRQQERVSAAVPELVQFQL
jgi:hypothetical protein